MRERAAPALGRFAHHGSATEGCSNFRDGQRRGVQTDQLRGDYVRRQLRARKGPLKASYVHVIRPRKVLIEGLN